MAQQIKVTDEEPAEEWLIKLAREVPDGQRYPERYDQGKVRCLGKQVREATRSRRQTLAEETVLSEREATITVLKEQMLNHEAIALALVDEWEDASTSTVDELARRAQEKYDKSEATVDELDATFGSDDEEE